MSQSKKQKRELIGEYEEEQPELVLEWYEKDQVCVTSFDIGMKHFAVCSMTFYKHGKTLQQSVTSHFPFLEPGEDGSISSAMDEIIDINNGLGKADDNGFGSLLVRNWSTKLEWIHLENLVENRIGKKKYSSDELVIALVAFLYESWTDHLSKTDYFVIEAQFRDTKCLNIVYALNACLKTMERSTPGWHPEKQHRPLTFVNSQDKFRVFPHESQLGELVYPFPKTEEYAKRKKNSRYLTSFLLRRMNFNDYQDVYRPYVETIDKQDDCDDAVGLTCTAFYRLVANHLKTREKKTAKKEKKDKKEKRVATKKRKLFLLSSDQATTSTTGSEYPGSHS
jgi:hypothetical protein